MVHTEVLLAEELWGNWDSNGGYGARAEADDGCAHEQGGFTRTKEKKEGNRHENH